MPYRSYNTAVKVDMEPKVSNIEAQKSTSSKNVSNDGGFNKEDLLVKVAQNSDREAFIQLFEYFAPRIKSFLMKSGVSPEMADELAQETMLTVWNKASSYDRSQANASTWIFTIARNKKIDMFRKIGRPQPDMNDPSMVGDDMPSPSEGIDRDQETQIVAAALEKLPKEQAELVYKSFFEEKTHQVISEETKIPLGTVKSRIRLALERLRSDTNVKELWT